METGAEQPPSRDVTPTEQKGKLLRPGPQGVLKQALNIYLANEPDFVAAYFPNVAARKYATYGDVFDLTDLQADALRPIMAESITHFLKEDGRERNRNVGLIDRQPIDPAFVSRAAKKAKFWSEALENLCEVYGLECPL